MNGTGVDFRNVVEENLYFNFINYSYIYNGGGIAVGDINNDGLEDVYFTSNQQSNKLYLNKGDFKFEDITEKSGVSDAEGWATGTTMVDINNDGFLDIYVCKSGSLQDHDLRRNKLYVNQQDGTFKELAKQYGLDYYGFSTQAYFFDFDLDNDLDVYLVNHREDFQNNTVIDPRIQAAIRDYSSDQLYRNDNGLFVNVTSEAGVANKAWGLSASIGDFNNDSYPDIYVANDFLEPDMLYINEKDGTFKNEIHTYFGHITYNSMGSDYADVNNDLQPDLIVLDMLAEDHIRGKENMATMSTENFNLMVNSGYHHQYMSNMLQLNNGNNSFSEIGQLANIAKTDWSWAPLIADFDNDGLNDLFVTNGIEHDLSNQDFRNQMRSNIQNRKKVSLEEAIAMMPSEKLSNYSFRNSGNLKFEDTSEGWGFVEKINSNGASYADLDNDGDLDLILNNQGDVASIYRNNSQKNTVSFRFIGPDNNRVGIGVKVKLETEQGSQIKTLETSRGFQSGVTQKLHFGLDSINSIAEITVTWPDGRQEKLGSLEAGKLHEIDYSNSKEVTTDVTAKKQLFIGVNEEEIGIDFIQKENEFDDYNLQLLLPQKQSEKSKALAVSDINGDGLDDFFVGNAKGEAGALFIQKGDGTFERSNTSLFESHKNYEDTNAIFFDADGDGDNDLFVTSGGYEFEPDSKWLADRLYINNGKGKFTSSSIVAQINQASQMAVNGDIDGDGIDELFVAGGVLHGKYPLSSESYILKFDGGKYGKISLSTLGDFSSLNMVNDAQFVDIDNDNDLDLVVVGEWMPVAVYVNNAGQFTSMVGSVFESAGWYQSITTGDINNDGYVDFLVGNYGGNNKFKPSLEKPLHIYADYLDANTTFDVVLSKVSKTGELLPVRGRECSTQQVPKLGQEVKSFKQFASLSLPDIYGEENLKNATHFTIEDMHSFVLLNDKKGGFVRVKIPSYAQIGPTLSAVAVDVNADGKDEFIGVGVVNEAEVETIKYDASKGYAISYEGSKMNLELMTPFIQNEVREMQKITIAGKPSLLLLNKNAKLEIIQIK